MVMPLNLTTINGKNSVTEKCYLLEMYIKLDSESTLYKWVAAWTSILLVTTQDGKIFEADTTQKLDHSLHSISEGWIEQIQLKI